MTGVYEHALGAEADELHPKVRERYSTDPEDDAICVGRGKMDISRGTHVLPALYAMTSRNLLFPEAGHDVPFTVRTVGFRDGAGREVLATIREFRFGRKYRRFDSLTVWDADNERLLDFLGTGDSSFPNSTRTSKQALSSSKPVASGSTSTIGTSRCGTHSRWMSKYATATTIPTSGIT